MKKLLFLLMIILSCAFSLSAQDAIYIYHQGRLLDGFPLHKVDSLKFSHYDTDSIYHEEWQMQDFYVSDTVYRVALTDIDSIAFRSPDIVYKSDVSIIDQEIDGQGSLLAWVDSVDYQNFIFYISKNTPQSLYPEIGSVLWVNQAQEPFIKGWAGRVKEISDHGDNLIVSFDYVTPNQIFDRYVKVGTIGLESTNYEEITQDNDDFNEDEIDRARRRAIMRSLRKASSSDHGEGSDYAVNFELPEEVDLLKYIEVIRDPFYQKENFDNIKFTIYPYAGATIDYKFDIGIHTHIKFYIDYEIGCKSNFGVQIGATKTDAYVLKDFSKLPPLCSSRVGATAHLPAGFFTNINLSIFLQFDANVSCSLNADFAKTGRLGFEYDSDEDENSGSDSSESPQKGGFKIKKIGVDLSGSLSAYGGLSFDWGAGWGSPHIAETGINFKLGPKLTLDFTTDLSKLADRNEKGVSAAYIAVKDLKSAFSLHGDVSAYYEIPALGPINSLWAMRHERTFISMDFLKLEIPLFPQFSELTLENFGSLSASVSGRVNNPYLFPSRVGLGIAKASDPGTLLESKIGKSYYDFDIHKVMFEGLSSYNTNSFRVFPVFTFLGKEYAAEPYLDFSNKLTLETKKVTAQKDKAKIEFHAGGFSNKHCFVWVYCAEKGENLILNSALYDTKTVTSLKFLKKSEHDVEVDIHNLKPETEYYVVLRLYEGETVSDGELVKESEPYYFTTAGDVAAEWVDLGLPSGNMWRSCNLGANLPEEYGKYYSWGQNTEYNPLDFNEERPQHDLLDSNEDPARKAGLGQMPSDEDFYELKSYCQWKSTKINGVAGVLGTAHNGNTIFFPLCGYKNDFDPSDKGKGGYYWTNNNATEKNAHCYIVDKGASWIPDTGDKLVGMSVRPVKK